LSAVSDLQAELIKAVTAYMTKEGIHELQGIKLPGMSKVKDLIGNAKKAAGKNELAVKAGIDSSGKLIASVQGVLPKKGGGADKYEKFEVIREGFATLVEEMKTEEHAVVNVTKEKDDSGGDAVINRASDKQGGKFATPVKTLESADFGGIKGGNVILCAHGEPEAVGGIVIGKKFGERTPEQIVQILTENPDKTKRLSKEFSGAVHLSGCFAAAGSGAVPEGYDYSAFGEKVLKVLRGKGYTKCIVRGHPGVAVTRDSGDKAATHAMETPKNIDYGAGAKAVQQQITEVLAAIQKMKAAHGGDNNKLAADPAYKPVYEKWAKLKKEHGDLVKADARWELVDGLVGNFGVKGR
jgi:hypothetical protein